MIRRRVTGQNKGRGDAARVRAWIAAVTLSAGVLVGSWAAPAQAASPDPITELSIPVRVITDGDTYMPATKFAFKVENGAVTEYDGQTVKAGAGGVTVSAVSYSPSEGFTDPGHSLKLSFDASVYGMPGIYHYKVKGLAKDPDTGKAYDGIVYDTVPRDLYVYVQNREAGGYEVFGAVLLKEGATAKNGEFLENYGCEDCDTPNDSTHDVEMLHKVTGNQGDKTRDFPFTVQVDGAPGEKYKVVLDGSREVTELSSGEKLSFTLRDGQKIRIYGLSPEDRYTFTPLEAGKDGYTTSYEGAMSGTLSQDLTRLVVTSDRTVAAATGVARSAAPLTLAMLAGLCLMTGTFPGRRRRG